MRGIEPLDAGAKCVYFHARNQVRGAQQEVRRLNDGGVTAEYVDPPDDLVGAG